MSSEALEKKLFGADGCDIGDEYGTIDKYDTGTAVLYTPGFKPFKPKKFKPIDSGFKPFEPVNPYRYKTQYAKRADKSWFNGTVENIWIDFGKKETLKIYTDITRKYNGVNVKYEKFGKKGHKGPMKKIGKAW